MLAYLNAFCCVCGSSFLLLSTGGVFVLVVLPDEPGPRFPRLLPLRPESADGPRLPPGPRPPPVCLLEVLRCCSLRRSSIATLVLL